MSRTVGVVLATAVVLVAAAAVFAVLAGRGVDAQPLPPNRFFGRATLNGNAASGVTVNAQIDGTTCGTATTDGSGNYRFDVPSSGEKSGCGTNGATVAFTVAGQRATQTGTWREGEFTQLDLSATGGTATATSTPSGPVTATSTATPPTGTATAAATAPSPAQTATPIATAEMPPTGSGGGESGAAWLLLASLGLLMVGAGGALAARTLRR